MARSLSGAASALVLLAVGAGCQELNTPLYFNGATVLDVDGMPVMGGAPRATDAVALRFRNPTDQERKDREARQAALGFDVPWIARANVHIEVLFTVKNLDTEEGTFNVLVDGANEYVKYDEAVVAAALGMGNGNDGVYLPLMQSRPQMLGPGQTFQGLLREDDLAEAESDLNAMDKWMAPFAAVLINRSDVNPIGMEMVPAGVVVPALIEVDVTFTASKHMTCTYLVRVRDDQDQLLHDAGDTPFSPSPTTFQPTLPPP